MKISVVYNLVAIAAQALLPFGSEALALEKQTVYRLTLKSKASVSSHRIYLSDIAKCSGDNIKCQEISGIDISSSPSPGRSSFIPRANIEAILEKEWPGANLVIDGSESTRVESVAVDLMADDLRSKFEDLLTRGVNGNSDVRLRVARFQPIGSTQVRPSQSKIEFLDASSLLLNDPQWILRNLIGNRIVRIKVSNPADSDDRSILQANASITMEMRIPTIKETVSVGHVLSAQDVELSWVVMRRGYQDLALAVGKIIGRKTRQTLHGGDPVSGRFLESPIAVERNQPVKMFVRKGDLEISTRAVTQDQGAVGQTIDVVNAVTRKKIRARIIDEQTVEAVAF